MVTVADVIKCLHNRCSKAETNEVCDVWMLRAELRIVLDEIERLQAFIAMMPHGLGQFDDWKLKQLEAAEAAEGE